MHKYLFNSKWLIAKELFKANDIMLENILCTSYNVYNGCINTHIANVEKNRKQVAKAMTR